MAIPPAKRCCRSTTSSSSKWYDVRVKLGFFVVLAACGGAGTVTSVVATPAPTPVVVVATPAVAPAKLPATAIADAKAQLLAKYNDQRNRIDRGVDQVAALWRSTAGDLVAL